MAQQICSFHLMPWLTSHHNFKFFTLSTQSHDLWPPVSSTSGHISAWHRLGINPAWKNDFRLQVSNFRHKNYPGSLYNHIFEKFFLSTGCFCLRAWRFVWAFRGCMYSEGWTEMGHIFSWKYGSVNFLLPYVCKTWAHLPWKATE